MSKLLQALNALIKATKGAVPAILAGLAAVVSFFQWGFEKMRAAVEWVDAAWDAIDVPDILYETGGLDSDMLQVANTVFPLSEAWDLFLTVLTFWFGVMTLTLVRRAVFFWK